MGHGQSGTLLCSASNGALPYSSHCPLPPGRKFCPCFGPARPLPGVHPLHSNRRVLSKRPAPRSGHHMLLERGQRPHVAVSISEDIPPPDLQHLMQAPTTRTHRDQAPARLIAGVGPTGNHSHHLNPPLVAKFSHRPARITSTSGSCRDRAGQGVLWELEEGQPPLYGAPRGPV
jgi:hypothetical protein